MYIFYINICKIIYKIYNCIIHIIYLTYNIYNTNVYVITWGIIKQGGVINHMKKDLLKLFNSHEECFIKFGKTNDHILNKLL